MPLRLPRVIGLVLAIVLIAGPVARYAVAGVHWDDIQCCCGTHDGDEECGCPDCPALHHDGEKPPADGAPRMKSCGATGELMQPAPVSPAVAPSPLVIVPAVAAIAVEPAPDPKPDDRSIEIETPPF